MPAHRLVVRALFTIAALGWPAAIAAQPAVTLPLHATRALVVEDAWEGYSAASPTRATYSLQRSADGSFAGTVQIRAGNGWLRRDTSFAVHLPRAAADSLLQALSEVPLQEGGSYRPTLTHTDDHPSITVELTVGDSVVRFHTTSQGTGYVPWRVNAGGRAYASASRAIWSSLSAALDHVGAGEKRALIEAVWSDPEAGCRDSRYMTGPEATPANRPRYAGNEAWFTRDSSITVEGRRYRKHGQARVLGRNEISPYSTYRGVVVSREAGIERTPEVIYIPVHATCELQPYRIEPRS